MIDITNLKVDFEGTQITKQHVMVMDKFSKYEKINQEAHYDEVALNYESVYLRAGYPDPKKVADMVNKYTKNKKSKVIDFGCGTGLIGKYLSEKGFDDITGLDSSQGMLDQAKLKDIYYKLEKFTIGQ